MWTLTCFSVIIFMNVRKEKFLVSNYTRLDEVNGYMQMFWLYPLNCNELNIPDNLCVMIIFVIRQSVVFATKLNNNFCNVILDHILFNISHKNK